MSISSVGGSFFSQAQFANPAGRSKEAEDKASVKALEEKPNPLRQMTPEEQEKLKKTLAGSAADQFRNILKDDAERAAQLRQAQGLSPTGVVVNVSA